MLCNNALRKQSPASPRYRNAHEPIFTAHPSESLLSSPQTAPNVLHRYRLSFARFSSLGKARADLPADWIRWFIRYFPCVAAKADRVCTRGTSKSTGDNNVPFQVTWDGFLPLPPHHLPLFDLSTRFSPRYAALLSPIVRSQTLYLFLDTCSIPSMSRTKDNVVANLRSIERWLYVARWMGCPCVRDTLAYRIGSGGRW